MFQRVIEKDKCVCMFQRERLVCMYVSERETATSVYVCTLTLFNVIRIRVRVEQM
jgi:hypothetical protein